MVHESSLKKIKELPDFDTDFAVARIKVLNRERLEIEKKNEEK